MATRPWMRLVGSLALLLAAGAAQACPTCMATMSGDGVPGMLNGVFWTAILLACMPFVVVGTIVHAVRTNLAEEAAQAVPEPVAMPVPGPRGGEASGS